MDFVYSIFGGGVAPQPQAQSEQTNNMVAALERSGFTPEDAKWLEDLGYTQPEVEERVKQGFTPQEIVNAVKLKLIHDKVEIAAYKALQQAIEDFKLHPVDGKTPITEAQSREILHKYIKNAAHVVMRGEGGYMKVRGQYLSPKQIQPVMANVPLIVRDRDSKLTDASYTTLEKLVGNLDYHNMMVNGILFNAWGVPHREGAVHLECIKKQAGFTGTKAL
jgi:hypothetical protein